MAPSESRNGEHINRVRNFTANEHFDKSVAKEKWDTAKIKCIQLFNSHVQYGLSFVRFTGSVEKESMISNSSKTEATPIKIGAFSLRPALGGDDSDDEPKSNIFFHKKASGTQCLVFSSLNFVDIKIMRGRTVQYSIISYFSRQLIASFSLFFSISRSICCKRKVIRYGKYQ